jgi:hypothetical protein
LFVCYCAISVSLDGEKCIAVSNLHDVGQSNTLVVGSISLGRSTDGRCFGAHVAQSKRRCLLKAAHKSNSETGSGEP